MRPSPKSFPHAWLRAGIASRFTAASGIRSRVIAAFGWFTCPPGVTSISTPSFTRFSPPLHLIFHRADAALYCNGANAIFTLPPRVFGIPTLLNVDGLERKRKKWNRLAKAWYAMSEWLATFCPNVVITDARQIEAYYLERYGKRTQFIPYGAETGKVATRRGSREAWPGTPAATFCTSAAWSRKTMRCWCGRRSSRVATPTQSWR